MPTSRHRRLPGAAFFGRIARESRFRHVIHRLESMDDALLRDIGIDRPGIRRAVRGRD
jgi:uncharacterized protein YjiS (DUF1127 family)